MASPCRGLWPPIQPLPAPPLPQVTCGPRGHPLPAVFPASPAWTDWPYSRTNCGRKHLWAPLPHTMLALLPTSLLTPRTTGKWMEGSCHLGERDTMQRRKEIGVM